MLTIYVAQTDALKDGELFDSLYHDVPQCRQQKIDRMRFDKDKRLSLGAGLLLKQALNEANIDDNCIHIDYSSNKKPYIKEYPEFHFNLSHSEECVICAVSAFETGCDVEKVVDIDLDIAKKYFSPQEYEFIVRQNNINNRIDIFFRLWTLKESYMKARGCILTMDAFCIQIKNNIITVECDDMDNDYSFYEFDLFPGYKFAACVKSASMDVTVKRCWFGSGRSL
ncbi:MAG: 4'-phosphopantetheinyl transferase superfamily protein [Proteobacteria bacterium]|nr:4'-phosphopantetheinyl transferase superfamily protein [Pseudomonadota bacterium]